MRNLKRIYYRLFKRISISRSVSLLGDFENVKNSIIQIGSFAKISIGKGVVIKNSQIQVDGGELIIGDGVHISDYSIDITPSSRVYLGANCILERGDNWRNPCFYVWDNSSLIIANNNRIRCDIMCRFGGHCEIGEYNCINERTEIRCDESVKIGAFNMISYNCRIWDTNTHAFYKDDTRRRMTREEYPNIGSEKDKPVTRSVVIGDDCLLGEECVILKGSNVGNRCVIGVHSVVAGASIPTGTMAVGNPVAIKNFSTRSK